MIKLSNMADYAVELMCFLAIDPERLFSATEIAQLTKIPAPTVSKILGILVRNDLLASHRGLKGGFNLAQCAQEITIADIVEAVDGPIQLTNCITGGDESCDRHHDCGTRQHWYKINDAVKGALSGVLLADMVMRVPDFIQSDIDRQRSDIKTLNLNQDKAV